MNMGHTRNGERERFDGRKESRFYLSSLDYIYCSDISNDMATL